MKRQEALKELSKLSKDDLQKSLREKQENLRVFRFDLAAGKIKDIRQIRTSRRNIARILTLIKK
ncbi:MAG: 50S ribosomal protein L29 [bacterium]|nr:50S ribosomal protein L29 [bacterium]